MVQKIISVNNDTSCKSMNKELVLGQMYNKDLEFHSAGDQMAFSQSWKNKTMISSNENIQIYNLVKFIISCSDSDSTKFYDRPFRLIDHSQKSIWPINRKKWSLFRLIDFFDDCSEQIWILAENKIHLSYFLNQTFNWIKSV